MPPPTKTFLVHQNQASFFLTFFFWNDDPKRDTPPPQEQHHFSISARITCSWGESRHGNDETNGPRPRSLAPSPFIRPSVLTLALKAKMLHISRTTLWKPPPLTSGSCYTPTSPHPRPPPPHLQPFTRQARFNEPRGEGGHRLPPRVCGSAHAVKLGLHREPKQGGGVAAMVMRRQGSGVDRGGRGRRDAEDKSQRRSHQRAAER